MPPLIFNGTTITGDYTVKYGNTELTNIVYNGQTVWEKNTQRMYRFAAKACRYGKTSLQLPTSAGLFTLNSTYPAVMFCFQDTLDVTGYNTTLSQVVAKNWISATFYFTRTNTYAYSSPTNTAWTYNQQISNGGITAIANRHATYHIDKAPPNPTAVGYQNSGLTTDELKTIFNSSYRYLLSSASGSGCNALTANNYYWAFGFRCNYPPSGAPQLRCDNISNHYDVFLDVLAQ